MRVSRRQIWMPLHLPLADAYAGDYRNTAVWQAELERVLRLMHRMLHDPGR